MIFFEIKRLRSIVYYFKMKIVRVFVKVKIIKNKEKDMIFQQLLKTTITILS